MSTIKLIDPITDPRWDKFVESHPFGWICHLSGWKQVLEKSFKHMKGYYFARMDNLGKNIEAAFPIFEVRSWLTGRRLVSIPFASLSDPLVSSREDMGEFLEATIKLSQELKSSYIEIRALASPSFIHDDRFGKSDFYKHHYLLLSTDPENLRKKFHRTCVRQRITRAEKSDIHLKIGKKEGDLKQYHSLHTITRKRLGLPSQPYIFFKNLWDEFYPSNMLSLLLAEENGNAISGIILFKFKDRVSVEFAASDEKFRDMSPNHYLFWEAIKLASAEEYKIFDFGRTSPLNKSLMDFKMRWGTEVVDLPQFFYPKEICLQISKMEESGRYKLAKYLTAKAPDFTQQLIGKFFYRHLG